MELHTGNCAFCKNSLVIHCRQLQEIWQSIFHIFKKYTSNENELKRIRSELEVCPSCVDMLSIIERNLKEIERYTKNKQFSSKCCLLCGKATTLYKIKEEYKDIAFILNKYKGVSKIKSFMLCSGCFHLTNNSKLMFGQFSRIYPALLNSSINSNSLKTNSPQIRTTSKSKTKFTKKLRPIKSSSYKLNNVVKSDKKLYNEIPYVKVERLVNKPEFSEKIKRLNKPSFKIKLKKHSTIRNAIKRKSTKTSDLLNLGRVLRVDIVRGTLTDSLTAPVKTKGAVKLLNDYSPRKSVTFAEKNIEIEDNFYLNSNNDSIDEKNTVSKSILKNKSPIIKKNIDQDSNLKKKRRLTTFITISSDESDDGLRNWEGGVNVKKSKTKETKSDVNVNGTTENSNTKINLIENRLIVAGKSPRNEISKTKTSEKKRKPRPKSKQREKIKKSDGDEKEQTPQKKRKTQQKSVLADSDNKEKSPSPSNESNDWNSFTSLTSEQMFDQLFKTDNTNKKKYKPKPKSKQTESRLKDKEEQNEGATTVSEKQNGISSDTVVTEPIKPTENDIPKEDNAEFSDVTEDEINLCESFNLDSDENNCADAQNVQNTNDNANIDQSCKDNQNNNAENTKESNEETDSNSIKNNEKTSDSKSNDPISECLPEEELTKNLDNDLIVEKPDDLTESLNNKVTESAIEPSTSKNDDTLLENSISDQDKSTSSSKNTPKKKHKPRPLSKKKKIETNSKGETANASHDNDNSFKETTISDQKETESVNKELTLSQINNTLNLTDEDNAESPKPSGTVNDDVDDDIDKIANKYLSINRPSILDSDKKNISEKFDIDDLIIKDATTELYDDL